MGAASSGGDFMSDLFNKLAMRRKGEAAFYAKLDLKKKILMQVFGSADSK